MASNYQIVQTRFWHDEKVSQLVANEKMLLIYLLTSPSSNPLGLYVLRRSTIMDDIGGSIKQVADIVSAWCSGGPHHGGGVYGLSTFCEYDPAVSLVWVRNKIRLDPPKNWDHAKSVLDSISTLPKSHLSDKLIQYNQQFTGASHKGLRAFAEQCLHHGGVCGGVYVPHDGGGVSTPIPTSESYLLPQPPTPIPTHKNPPPAVDVDFESFWAMAKIEYTKVGSSIGSKPNAAARYKKHVTADNRQMIVDALKAQADGKLAAGKTAGAFAPPFKHLERWLENQMWNDNVWQAPNKSKMVGDTPQFTADQFKWKPTPPKTEGPT